MTDLSFDEMLCRKLLRIQCCKEPAASTVYALHDSSNVEARASLSGCVRESEREKRWVARVSAEVEERFSERDVGSNHTGV